MKIKRLILVLGLCVLLLAACCMRDTDNDGIVGNDKPEENQNKNDMADDSLTNGMNDKTDNATENNMAGDVVEDMGNAAGELADGVGNAAKDVADGVGNAAEDMGNGARNLTRDMIR